MNRWQLQNRYEQNSLQKDWNVPYTNDDINDYEHYWFVRDDISSEIAQQKEDQKYDPSIVNLYNVTFDLEYSIKGGSSSDSGNSNFYDLPAFFGHADRTPKEQCEQDKTGYFN